MEWIQEELDEVRSEDNSAEDFHAISFHVIFFRILSSYLLTLFLQNGIDQRLKSITNSR